MENKKIMRDISLNEPVPVTLPAHVWLGFISAYASTEWSCEDVSIIAQEAIRQLFDPLYLNEKEAAMQEQHDQQQSVLQAIITGRRPETPPHMEEDT